jgi:hypothetical protein
VRTVPETDEVWPEGDLPVRSIRVDERDIELLVIVPSDEGEDDPAVRRPAGLGRPFGTGSELRDLGQPCAIRPDREELGWVIGDLDATHVVRAEDDEIVAGVPVATR